MKALYFKNHGTADALEYGELPDPTLPSGYARVKVSCAALNHLDLWVLQGWPGLNLALPHIGGSDIVGTLIETNGNCNLAVGTRVMIDPSLTPPTDEWTLQGEHSVSPRYRVIGEHTPGGFAEQVVVPIENIHAAPEGVDDATLASALLVGVTSWRMLFDRAGLRAGETVLIVGSGGGVNNMSLQMAKAAGAIPIVVAGTDRKAALAKQYGAMHTINYRSSQAWHRNVLNFTDGLGVDVVVDNVGQATFSKSLKAAKPGGRIVTVGNTSGPEVTFDNRLLFTKQLSLIGSTMGNPLDFKRAMAFIVDHGLWPHRDMAAPLSDGMLMYERMRGGDHFGKIVLMP